MSALELDLYELLKIKLGEKETKALWTLVENKTDAIEHKIEHKIHDSRTEYITIADKEKLLTKADALTIFATKQDIANSKTDIIKWLVSLIIGLFIALIGSMITILKIMNH